MYMNLSVYLKLYTVLFLDSKQCFQEILNIQLDKKCFVSFESLSSTEHRQSALN